MINALKKDAQTDVQTIGLTFSDFQSEKESMKGRLYDQLYNEGHLLPDFKSACVTTKAMGRAYSAHVKGLMRVSYASTKIGKKFRIKVTISDAYTFLINFLYQENKQFLMFDQTPPQEYVQLLLINFDPDNLLGLYEYVEGSADSDLTRAQRIAEQLKPENLKKFDAHKKRFDALPNLKDQLTTPLNAINGTVFAQLQLVRRTKVICKKRRRYHKRYQQRDKLFALKYGLSDYEDFILGSTVKTFKTRWLDFTMEGLANKQAIKMYKWVQQFQFQVAKYEIEKKKAIKFGNSIKGLDLYKYYVENGIELFVLLKEQISDTSITKLQKEQLKLVRVHEDAVFTRRRKLKIQHVHRYIENIRADKEWFETRIKNFKTVEPKLFTLLSRYENCKNMVELLSILPIEACLLQNVAVLMGMKKEMKRGLYKGINTAGDHFIGTCEPQVQMERFRLKTNGGLGDGGPSMVCSNINDGRGIYGKADNDAGDDLVPGFQQVEEQANSMDVGMGDMGANAIKNREIVQAAIRAQENANFQTMVNNIKPLEQLSDCVDSEEEDQLLNQFGDKEARNFRAQRNLEKETERRSKMENLDKVRRLFQAQQTPNQPGQAVPEHIASISSVYISDSDDNSNQISIQSKSSQGSIRMDQNIDLRTRVGEEVARVTGKTVNHGTVKTTVEIIVVDHTPEVINLAIDSQLINLVDLQHYKSAGNLENIETRKKMIVDLKFDETEYRNETIKLFRRRANRIWNDLTGSITKQIDNLMGVSWVTMRMEKKTWAIKKPMLIGIKLNNCSNVKQYTSTFIGFVQKQSGFSQTPNPTVLMSDKIFKDIPECQTRPFILQNMRDKLMRGYYNIFILAPPFGHELILTLFEKLETQLTSLKTPEGQRKIWETEKEVWWVKLFVSQAQQALNAWKKLICNFSVVAGIPYLVLTKKSTLGIEKIVPKWECSAQLDVDNVPIFTQDDTAITRAYTLLGSIGIGTDVRNKAHKCYDGLIFERDWTKKGFN